MPEAVTNTSPLLYLHSIGTLNWLPELFSAIVVPAAVVRELQEGRQRGYDVPDPADYAWLEIAEPGAVPSEWFALDLGPGELAVLALGLEDQRKILLLDDGLARRIAHAARLQVWGTLTVLLESKKRGLTGAIAAHLQRLEKAGKSGRQVSGAVSRVVSAGAARRGGAGGAASGEGSAFQSHRNTVSLPSRFSNQTAAAAPVASLG
jgi:predicted nucleic acid-binding protein